MNRFERRKLQKKMKGQNLIVNPGVENINRENNTWCWRHKLKLDNVDRPTEEDRKRIDSVRFRPFKTRDKNGELIMGRSCPRCGNTILIQKSSLIDATKDSILITPQGGEYQDVSLHVPNVPEKV